LARLSGKEKANKADRRLNIAYFGYDFFWPCLSKLIESGHNIQSVFTYLTDNRYNYNYHINRLADSNGIPVKYDRITNEDMIRLEQSGCDLLVSAAYPYRIPVRQSGIRGINIHPTQLPHGRGQWPLPHLILHSSEHAGVTIHKLDQDFDTGDMLIQQSITINPDETLESLSARTQLLATTLLTKVMENLDKVWDGATPQGKGSYWPMPTESDRTIDWREPVANIERMVRAFGKFVTYAEIEGKKYYVQEVTVWKEKHNIKPGTLAHEMNRELVVAAKDGFVCLRFYEPA